MIYPPLHQAKSEVIRIYIQNVANIFEGTRPRGVSASNPCLGFAVEPPAFSAILAQIFLKALNGIR
jgi:biotin carboxylase